MLCPFVIESKNMVPYNESFYRITVTGSSSSARKVVPYLVSSFKPQSVVDVGCGTGIWAAEFRSQGIPGVIGIAGTMLEKWLLKIPANAFRHLDLERPLVLKRTFDMAISLEVAEHLSPQRASSFIKDLVRLAPVVVFSAAIPLQGGTDHI